MSDTKYGGVDIAEMGRRWQKAWTSRRPNHNNAVGDSFGELTDEIERLRALLDAVGGSETRDAGAVASTAGHTAPAASEIVARLDDLLSITVAPMSRAIVEDAKAEIEDWQRSFALYLRACHRGIAMWQAANPGNDLVHPDQGKLVAWLLNLTERAALASPSTEGWRGMESAPKDGTEVLLFAKGKPRTGFWDDGKFAKTPQPYWHYISAWGIRDMRANPPTHWMPLPSPPAPEQAAAATVLPEPKASTS